MVAKPAFPEDRYFFTLFAVTIRRVQVRDNERYPFIPVNFKHFGVRGRSKHRDIGAIEKTAFPSNEGLHLIRQQHLFHYRIRFLRIKGQA